MSETEWICPICNCNDSYPMMIVKCGHTFCEDCLERLKNCSICRTPYTLIDCQPNFALVAGMKTQPVKRTCNLDIKLKDLVRKIQINLDCLVNKAIESIIEQIDKQLTEYPTRTLYQCEITSPSIEVVSRVIGVLTQYNLLVDFTDELKKILLEDENCEKITISIFLKSVKKTNSVTGLSSLFSNLVGTSGIGSGVVTGGGSGSGGSGSNSYLNNLANVDMYSLIQDIYMPLVTNNNS